MAYANGSAAAELDVDPTLGPHTIVFSGDYRVMERDEDPSTPLYSQQAALPALPVPELAASVEMYLESVAAVATSPEQMEKARADARELMKPGGLGERLQERWVWVHGCGWVSEGVGGGDGRVEMACESCMRK
jgi:hypothetical protein